MDHSNHNERPETANADIIEYNRPYPNSNHGS